MPGFSYTDIAKQFAYDFTGCPKDDGSGPCTGKGLIPEPSLVQIEAFFNSLSKGFQPILDAVASGDADALAASVAGDTPEEKRASTLATMAAFREAVAAVCSNKPSLAELTDLPPRIFGLFARYVMEELSVPKGTSATTS